jgi:hypothetical protein
VGFVHQFRPLSAEEVTFILTRQWEQLGLRLVAAGAEAITVIR